MCYLYLSMYIVRIYVFTDIHVSAGYVCCILLLYSPLMVTHHVEPCCHCSRLPARCTFMWCLCLENIPGTLLDFAQNPKSLCFQAPEVIVLIPTWPMSQVRRCFWRMDHHCWMIGDLVVKHQDQLTSVVRQCESVQTEFAIFPDQKVCSDDCFNTEEIALQCETIDSSHSWSESYAKFCWIRDEIFREKPLIHVAVPRCCQVVSHGQQLLSRLFGMRLSRTCRLSHKPCPAL